MSDAPRSGPDLSPFALPAELPFTSLDRAFARFLAKRQPATDPRQVWLAALASHHFRRSNAHSASGSSIAIAPSSAASAKES